MMDSIDRLDERLFVEARDNVGAIRDDLEKRLPAMRDLEWWSVGQADGGALR